MQPRKYTHLFVVVTTTMSVKETNASPFDQNPSLLVPVREPPQIKHMRDPLDIVSTLEIHANALV